jgi:RNA polymerase sigma-70 factor (ECF subfamily)
MPVDPHTRELVDRIRGGDEAAWQECIARFEGRLLAFAQRRVRNAAAAEDIVQETFLGFLTALPNYDDRTPLESFLFAIAAHKLTDHLRREGRRPTLALPGGDSTPPGAELSGRERVASSLARSHERKSAEAGIVAECLGELIARWKERGEWERLKCLELLLVRGRPNKDVAERLGISEQTVANHKHFVVAKLKEAGDQAKVRDFDLGSLGIEAS